VHLQGPVTIAVLPFAPHTRELVGLAALFGKDIIVHQPMEPTPSRHAREEHGTLKLNMARSDFDAVVIQALDAIPERVGVSNHTGSLLTAHRQPMVRLMAQLNERGLYFLDSRTTAQTVALQVAREMGVPATRRDVFLDHDRRPEAVAAAFAKALKIARTKGHAVLVGHPYSVSLELLEEKLADLPRDIRLVSVAELAATQSQQPAIDPGRLALRQPPTDPRISLGQ
jgi:polysaccharide deacetylase 2 family uncharacterized protein YibQ